MTFRPRLATRLALAFVGFANPALAVVLVANLGLASVLDSLWVALAWFISVIYFPVRGYRMMVRVDADHVVIRGWWWTRTVPRTAVRTVTVFPALRWVDRAGRRRWSPLWMFVQPTLQRDRQLDAEVDALTRVIEHRGSSAPGRQESS
jgi:hypothetical protein